MAIKGRKKHIERMHSHLEKGSQKNLDLFNKSRIFDFTTTKFTHTLNEYSQMLPSSGVGKRDQVSTQVAQSYCKQISVLVTSKEGIQKPEKVYQNLQNKITGTGANLTRYTIFGNLAELLGIFRSTTSRIHENPSQDPSKTHPPLNETLQKKKRKTAFAGQRNVETKIERLGFSIFSYSKI